MLFVIDRPLALVLSPAAAPDDRVLALLVALRERTKVLQEELGAATALVEETIGGIRVVKGLGAGDALTRRFRARSDASSPARSTSPTSMRSSFPRSRRCR